MSGVLALSNIINVTVTPTPSGISERNVNSLALFTTSQFSSGNDVFREYLTASSVSNDFGSSSTPAKMAGAIFAQTPNILTGTGRLLVIPLLQSATSATSGKFETPDISSNISNFTSVADGEFEITIDGGTPFDVTSLDFSNVEDVADIAKIINRAVTDVTVTEDSGKVVFTSDKVGASTSVSIAAVSGGSGTDITAATLLDTSSGTSTSGADSSGETILEAITRVQDEVAFTGVLTDLNLEDSAIETAANGIQSQDRLFFHHVSSTTDIDGIGTTVANASNRQTRLLLYTDNQEEANLFKSAYAGRALSVNFNGTDTSQTMQLKQLATITPDSGITQTDYTQTEDAGLDTYVSFRGRASVNSTGGNDYFDNIYNDLALKFALETAGFNALAQTNTKVPQTEEGLSLLKAAYTEVMERFVRVGAFAPGSWTSTETFGDPAIFKQNISQYGFYVYSIPIAQQSAADRAARKAPLVQIAAKRAGAIHTSDVIVVVND